MDLTTDPNAPQNPATPPLDPSLQLVNTPSYINPAYATPNQKAQLYAYAQEMMKPQPINNWAQGLSSLAHALMGGYLSHQADVAEQASQAQNKQDFANTVGVIDAPGTTGGGGNMAMPASGGADQPAPVTPTAATANPSSVESYVQQSAAARGINPAVASRMLMGESSGDPAAVGDKGSSFGPLQLHYGGVSKQYPNAGLGDAFTAATGLDARDPSTWQKQVDFALDTAKHQGWKPWATTRDKNGFGNFTGIGQGQPQPAPAVADAAPSAAQPMVQPHSTAVASNAPWAGGLAPVSGAPLPPAITQGGGGVVPPAATAFAGPSGGPPQEMPPLTVTRAPVAPAAPLVPPQHVALAQALMGPQGRTMNGLPVSAGAIGELLGNENISPEMKRMAQALLEPKPYSDAVGNQYVSRQFQPPGAPIFQGGVLRDQGTGSLPSLVGGNPAAPTNTLAPPALPGQTPVGASAAPGSPPVPPGAGAASVFGPNGVLGQLSQAQTETNTRNNAIQTTGATAADQYAHDRSAAANYQQTITPLTHALQSLQNLGPTGTGPGTEGRNEIVSFLQSVGAGQLLGIDPEKIKDYDEAQKYLTQYAQSAGDPNTNDKLAAAFAGNPNVHVSNAAAIDVVKTAMSLQRFKQAQIVSFQNAVAAGKASPTDYSDYALHFAQTYDPRAMGLDLMTPAAKRALDAEMPANGTPEQKAARAKFNASVALARQAAVSQ